MSAFDTSLAGLRTSSAQFERAASNIVRAGLPIATAAVPSGGGPPPPLSLAGLDFGADLVGATLALANYRANIAVLKVATRITKDALDLIV